jgi:hypothetical protein
LSTFGAERIYYPLNYAGSFETSDEMLNRIWITGAYTAHATIQDLVFDGIKRDRLAWMGDLYIINKTLAAFTRDLSMSRATMEHLIPPTGKEVNGIPGYTAFWILGVGDYFRSTGDMQFLHDQAETIARLVTQMSSNFDASGEFEFKAGVQPFVDWSPSLFTDTPSSRAATTLAILKAAREAEVLLKEVGDVRALDAQALSDRIMQTTPSLDLGSLWQTHSMLVYSGASTDLQTQQVWDTVLSRPAPQVVTPYYAYFAISAMAEANRRKEAVDFVRSYWGGMLAEGATTFWEAYDPAWPKQDFHRHLQAVNREGYYVSLCHGWSSGVTAWLTAEILGIKQTEGQVPIVRPELVGLSSVRGTVPLSSGLISVDYTSSRYVISVPSAAADLVLPSQGNPDIIPMGCPIRASL